MTVRTIPLLLTVLSAAALAACSDKTADDNRTAQGQVLEGSVSDAMLPMDTVRSQAPLAPRAAPSDVQTKDIKDASSPKPAAVPVPLPSDSVTPEPSPAAPAAT